MYNISSEIRKRIVDNAVTKETKEGLNGIMKEYIDLCHYESRLRLEDNDVDLNDFISYAMTQEIFLRLLRIRYSIPNLDYMEALGFFYEDEEVQEKLGLVLNKRSFV